MMTMNPPFSPTLPLSRQTCLALLRRALHVNEPHYAQQVALGWLGFYPGDLEVNFLFAQALEQESASPNTALHSPRRTIYLRQRLLEVVEKIATADPEFLPAQQMLARLQRQISGQPAAATQGALYILSGETPSQADYPEWWVTLRAFYEWLTHPNRPLGIWEKETLTLAPARQMDPFQALSPTNPALFPLAAVIQTRLLAQYEDDPQAVIPLLEAYLQRWSNCVPLKLSLAELWMKTDPSRGVALYHEAVALDPAGQVARRLLGEGHPYLQLWPLALEVSPHHPNAPQNIPLPAKLAAAMGWNLLADGSAEAQPREPTSAGTTATVDDVSPHTLPSAAPQPVQLAPPASQKSAPRRRSAKKTAPHPALEELRQIAARMKQPAIGRLDGRYPVYVILSAWNGLVNQYGEAGAQQILAEMRRLAQAVSGYRQWDSLVFLPDAPQLTPDRRTTALSPARPDDPWEIKLALADLDEALEKVGEMIGAVLIVGGPEIVPFHHLPNPVDDSDADVPSDNPYASRDENYFIPEWCLGRLPGGQSADPALLLQALQQIRAQHAKATAAKPGWAGAWQRMRRRIAAWLEEKFARSAAYGYSAAIWRRASVAVFRPIGDLRRLWVCPPVQVKESCAARRPDKPCITLPKGRLAYFNLHGLPDQAEWYGQRDPAEPGDLPDFPTALRAADIHLNGRPASQASAPEIIFAEACYGAHIQGKTTDDSLALRFLAAGCRAFVGSTCISYGSISNPLIAADLLGRTFWHYLKEGQPAGEALRRAKIHLAKEMNKRQGYLDGEDQKTLLSFVLYGDPLAQVADLRRGPKMTMRPSRSPGAVLTACDRLPESVAASAIPAEVIKQVKQLASIYLPGMQDAEIRLSQERTGCAGAGHLCPSAALHAKTTPQPRQTGRQVVILSKTVQQEAARHTQFARMTLDAQGAVIKLAVSR